MDGFDRVPQGLMSTAIVATIRFGGDRPPTIGRMTPCSPPSRRGLATAECVASSERRPSLTASARDVVVLAGRDEETVLQSNKETEVTWPGSRSLRRGEAADPAMAYHEQPRC